MFLTRDHLPARRRSGQAQAPIATGNGPGSENVESTGRRGQVAAPPDELRANRAGVLELKVVR
jgi:hypothetical protein